VVTLRDPAGAGTNALTNVPNQPVSRRASLGLMNVISEARLATVLSASPADCAARFPALSAHRANGATGSGFTVPVAPSGRGREVPLAPSARSAVRNVRFRAG